MKIKCPLCGDEIEVGVALKDGQRVRCAVCGEIFSYMSGEPVVVSRKSRSVPVKCPHCGKSHELKEIKPGKYAVCPFCRKWYALGGPKASADTARTDQHFMPSGSMSRQNEARHKEPGCFGCLFKSFLCGLFLVGIVVGIRKAAPGIFNELIDPALERIKQTPSSEPATTLEVEETSNEERSYTPPRPAPRPEPRRQKQVWKYDGDPLDNYLLCTYKVTRQEDFVLSDFLGFQTMKITYTSKGRIASICLRANDSARLSVSYTDYIVKRLMARCDLKYGPIDWTVSEQVSGAKYAKGRCFHFNRLDKIFVIIPTGNGGIEAMLISARAQREDDGYEHPDGTYDQL